MAVLRDKVLQQLPIELTNSWISIVDERKFNADVGAHQYLDILQYPHSLALAALRSALPSVGYALTRLPVSASYLLP